MSRYTLLLLAALLPACSVLPKAEPITTYLLPNAAPLQAKVQPSPLTLTLARPLASQALDSTRIAVVPEGNQISTYKGARWADNAPALLRAQLLDELRSRALFKSVNSDEQHLASDWQLLSNLLDFQSDYQDGTVRVLIRFDAQLIDASSRKVLASRRFVIEQPSASEKIPQVVQAFGKASAQLADQLSQWLSSQIKAQ